MTYAPREVDLVIRGAQVVSPEQIIPASVAVAGEHIVAVGHDDCMPAARQEMRADGLYLLPGAIDSHVHFRDPGYPHKETWKTGSAAAACGGVTTVFEMPNTHPPTGTLEALALKLKAAESSYVDYGIHGLLGDDTIDKLEQLLEGGVSSFKAFVGNTFGNLPAPTDGALLEGFEILAPLGIRTVVHAENSSIMARRQAQLQAAGRIDPLAHLDARPAVAEIEAIGRVLTLAEWTGARVHIAHHSAADSLFLLRQAKARGVDVTAETCPQYMLLNTEHMRKLAGVMRVNPPIREPRHNQPLWDALLEGVLDMIATDHAPHTPETKERPFEEAPPGMLGLETAAALALTELVEPGILTLEQALAALSWNPARIAGIDDRHGRTVAPGAPANLCVLDPAATWTVDPMALASRAHNTPYAGRTLRGRVRHTVLRGERVVLDGRATR